MFEYLIKEYDEYNKKQIEKDLDSIGEQRWELTHVSSSLRTYFFKRLKIKSTTETERGYY